MLFTTRSAVRVFSGLYAQQRAGDLPQFFGDFGVERLQHFLVFEFDRLFRKILRQWLIAMPRLLRNTVMAFEQLVFASEQPRFDCVLIHVVSHSVPYRDHTPSSQGARDSPGGLINPPACPIQSVTVTSEAVMAEIRPLRGAIARPIEINRVLRNTYLLLALTLAFSSIVTYVAIAAGAPRLGFIPTLIGFFGLLFVVQRLANSAWGLLAVFAFTGFLGYSLGPLLSLYLKLPNGHQLVGQALGLTSGAFVGLSAYALITRKDFSFLSGFLVAGFFV